MNERAYRHHDDQVVALTRAEAGAALDGTGFVWVHFDVCDDDARAWLGQVAKLSDVVVAALLATETRPRFDAFDDGALLNLRGPAIEGADSSDLLASIRLWVAQGQVFSVARHALRALDVIEMQMKACRIVDPGDLVASLASEITIELDPDVAKLGDTLDHCEEVFGDRNALALRRIIARTRSPVRRFSLGIMSPRRKRCSTNN